VLWDCDLWLEILDGILERLSISLSDSHL